MRALLVRACLTLAAAAGIARADVLWDNGEFHRHGGLSGERNTWVPESWTVDNVILTVPAIARGFEWFTLVTDDLDAVGADLLVLDAGFEPVAELSDLPFTRTLEGVAFGLDYYRVRSRRCRSSSIRGGTTSARAWSETGTGEHSRVCRRNCTVRARGTFDPRTSAGRTGFRSPIPRKVRMMSRSRSTATSWPRRGRSGSRCRACSLFAAVGRE